MTTRDFLLGLVTVGGAVYVAAFYWWRYKSPRTAEVA